MTGSIKRSMNGKLIAAVALLTILLTVVVVVQSKRSGAPIHENEGALSEQPADGFVGESNTILGDIESSQSNKLSESSTPDRLSTKAKAKAKAIERVDTLVPSMKQLVTVDSYRQELLEAVEFGVSRRNKPSFYFAPHIPAHIVDALIAEEEYEWETKGKYIAAEISLALFDNATPEAQELFVSLLNDPTQKMESIQIKVNVPPVVTEIEHTIYTGETIRTRIEDHGLFQTITTGETTMRPVTGEEMQFIMNR